MYMTELLAFVIFMSLLISTCCYLRSLRDHVSIRLHDVRDYWNMLPRGMSDRYDVPSTSTSGRSWINSSDGSGTWASTSLQQQEQQQPLLRGHMNRSNGGSTEALVTGNTIQQQLYYPTTESLLGGRSNSAFVPHHMIVYEDELQNNANHTTLNTIYDPTIINTSTTTPATVIQASPQLHLQAYTVATLVTPASTTSLITAVPVGEDIL